MSFNPEKLNIKDLTIEEPEKEKARLVFNPEKDIPKETKQELIDHYKELKDGHKSFYLELCANLTLIGEKQKVREKDKKIFQELMVSEANDRHWLQFAEAAARLKILDEQYWQGGSWEKVEERLIQLGEMEPNSTFVNLAACMAIAGHKPKLSEADWKNIYSALEKVRMPGSGFSLTEIASHIKILGRDPGLTQDECDRIMDTFKANTAHEISYGSKDTRLNIFADELGQMAILSANEVIIPEGGGLRLVRHEKEDLQKLEKPFIPEKRNF